VEYESKAWKPQDYLTDTDPVKFIMHDVDVRGTAILEIARLAPQSVQTWSQYFSSVLSGVARMWISIAAVTYPRLRF
jgi:hypothetical protein